MAQTLPFGEVLEVVEQLSTGEKEELIVIVQRRLAAEGRKRVADEVQETRQEYLAGRCRTATADEIMSELQA